MSVMGALLLQDLQKVNSTGKQHKNIYIQSTITFILAIQP